MRTNVFDGLKCTKILKTVSEIRLCHMNTAKKHKCLFFCMLYVFLILLQLASGSLFKFHDHIYNNIITDVILVLIYVRFS